ncbi:MAG TPA: hypothetical protein VHZ73_08615 [Vicinamibacterales bacterium]|jgi:hypothetical protein|nr:hypothetical protein [Vicinamibacterales bacterium]
MLKHMRFLALVAAVAVSSSCGSAVRQGRSPMNLIVQSMAGGVSAATASGIFESDVVTNVTTPAPCSPSTPCPTVISDSGIVTLATAPKDVTSPSAPTANNAVTITQYHVEYTRSDGRNTQGVDIPYAFDGAMSGTIQPGSNQSFVFELVRTVAKEEAPLIQLTSSSSVLSMVANVTFYGHDEAGNDLNVTGSITIEFGNFGG